MKAEQMLDYRQLKERFAHNANPECARQMKNICEIMVRDFIEQNQQELAPLSIREGSKDIEQRCFV